MSNVVTADVVGFWGSVKRATVTVPEVDTRFSTTVGKYRPAVPTEGGGLLAALWMSRYSPTDRLIDRPPAGREKRFTKPGPSTPDSRGGDVL